ncbi:cytochrome oxidase complex assembly protein 1-domain-containing protein, partial [Vararia minispora EC-137]
PRPPPTEQPPPELFSSASKPRQYYARPSRDLPPYRSPWPRLLVGGAAGVGVWALFLLYTANEERIHSSVVQRILARLQDDDAVGEILGDAVRFAPEWWLNGSPWIAGSVGMIKGRIDISFRVKGHKGAGTVYFTSIRKERGEPFSILRFKLIADNGEVVQL